MATYTTFFYDLGRSDPYPNWINALLKSGFNLVFYTTKDFHDRLTYTKRDNLLFVYEDFDESGLEPFQLSWNKYKSSNPGKDSYKFAHLTHRKFDYVLRTIQLNPFGSTHFGWIDAGIAKVSTTLTVPEVDKDEIQLLIMSSQTYKYKNKGFVLSPKQMIAGGFFVGSKDHMIKFCKLMISERDKLELGLEQEHMVCVYMENRSLFLPYYGYYGNIISNLTDVTNPDRVYEIMIELAKLGEVKEAKRIFEKLDTIKYHKLNSIRNYINKLSSVSS